MFDISYGFDLCIRAWIRLGTAWVALIWKSFQLQAVMGWTAINDIGSREEVAL